MNKYRKDIVNQVPRIAVEFFATFSRFEFALKRGGFLKGAPGHKAEPDWNAFAGALGPDFFLRMQGAAEVDILFTAPPKRLTVIGPDKVKFQKPADIVNGQMLFEAGA